MQRSLKFGRTPPKNFTRISEHTVSWPELVEIFQEPTRRTISHETYLGLSPKLRSRSKHTGLFLGGPCRAGYRNSKGVLSRSVVNLDIDDGADRLWAQILEAGHVPALAGITHFVHSTRSHTPRSPKLRVIIPLARDVEPGEYEPVARSLAVKLDPDMKLVARESYPFAQGMFFPSVSADQEYLFFDHDGDGFYDPDPALVEYPPGLPERWPRAHRETVSAYEPGRKIQHPEDKKGVAPIVTAVCRVFDPWSFIEEFLSHVYEPSGERYVPVGATGAPSVRVYDDTFVQSDHGSDAANGQHNVFDLGRIHLFGDLDRDFDTEALSPAEWPSFKAMSELMLERPEVEEAFRRVKAEASAEKASAALRVLDEMDESFASPEDDGFYEGPTTAAAERAEEVATGDLTSLLDDLDEEDDEFADLIGDESPEEVAAKPIPTTEDVLDKAKVLVQRVKTLSDMDDVLERIRSVPVDVIKDYHRNLLVTPLQNKLEELTGDKPGKTECRKMLMPRVENLRDQLDGVPMPEWLEDWVFVYGDNVMFHVYSKEQLSREGFNGRFNQAAGAIAGTTERGVTNVSAYDIATQVRPVPTAYLLKFGPGQPELFWDDGLMYANTYKANVITEGVYKGDLGVRLFLRLLSDLFPDERHQRLVLDYCAHCVRYPGRLIQYAMLVKGAEQEGKSLIATLVARLLGPSNTSIINNDMLTEKFNSWSHGKLFCAIEEVRLPGRDSSQILNKLKPVITNDRVPIRAMQKDASTEYNYCNLFITTNYEDAMPLEADNTRYCVLFTRFNSNEAVKSWRSKRITAEGYDYVSTLYEHIELHPFQFRKFFEEYPFSEEYQPGSRAPMTEFKVRMAEDSKTDERQILDDMLSSGEDPAITPEILIWDVFKTYLERQGLGQTLRGRGVAGFLKPMGFQRARETSIRVDGSTHKVRVWTRHPTQVLAAGDRLSSTGLQAASSALKAHLTLEEEDADSLLDLTDKGPGGKVLPFRK